jgi:hypothetical protein
LFSPLAVAVPRVAGFRFAAFSFRTARLTNEAKSGNVRATAKEYNVDDGAPRSSSMMPAYELAPTPLIADKLTWYVDPGFRSLTVMGKSERRTKSKRGAEAVSSMITFS